MDVIMMTHPLMDGYEHVLSNDCRKWITDHSVERIVLMNVKNRTNPVLNSELNELVPDSELEILELPMIGLQDQKTPSELNGLPWQILTQICRQIRPNRDTTIFLGRGAAIYDHVLWLTSQCYPGVKALHIDSCQPVLNTRNIRNHAPIEQTILPAMLTSFLDDIKNKRIDVENHGYTDKERFMQLMNTTVLKGVAPALKEMVDEGGVEKYTYGTDVTYRLTPKALQDAVSTYFSQKPEKEADLPNLTIAFGRLPHIQSRQKDQVVEFDFFSYLTPLQPMDGLLVVLQRIDDSIPDSSIMTLEDALIKFEDSDFIGDLRHAHAVIDRRTKEYDIDVAQHLVVINPKPDPDFQMDLFLRLLAYCEEFEKLHGTRQWDIDLTMPLNKIRSAVSFFSYATHTPPTYVLKSRADSVIIPRRSLVLSLPNRMAKDAFEQQMNPHGNNKGDPNCLMGLYLWELENTNDEDEDIFAILDDNQSTAASIGIEPKNLKKKLEEYGLQKGNSHVHRVLGRLVQARLVSQKGSGFYLTDLGRFVAEQIHNIRQFEVIE